MFDGDEMNIHLAQSIQARNELKRIANVQYQIVGVKDSSPIIGCQQDTLSGAYMLTEPDVKMKGWEIANMLCNTTSETKYDIKMDKEYTGHEIFSYIIPEGINNTKKSGDKITFQINNGKLTTGHLDTSSLSFAKNSIIHFIWDKWGPSKTRRFIDDSQRLVLHYLLSRGQTVGFEDILINKDIGEKINQVVNNAILKCKYDITQYENDTEQLPLDIIEDSLKGDLSVVQSTVGMMLMNHFDIKNFFWASAKSGAKGKSTNVAQVNGIIGQNNVEGVRIRKRIEGRSLIYFHRDDDTPEARGFIKNSYLTGLRGYEFCYNAMAGREGLIDTAIKSVTWETPIIIIEDGQPKYIEIGRWIDNHLDSNPDKVDRHIERNLEIMDVENIYIPTNDEDGNVTWGPVVAVTRHDPGPQLYEIKTSGGRTVTVTESKSLLIWDEKTKKIREKPTPEVKLGDYVPITAELCTPPVVLTHIDMTKYFPKKEYLYGTDFNKAIELMNNAMNGRNKIPAGWWEANNGNSFVLPYSKKSSLQRALVRSKDVRTGYIYPYSANREDVLVPEKFELNEENGIFIGLFLADGHVHNGKIGITKENVNVKNFVKAWFDKHNITCTERVKITELGKTVTNIGHCTLMSEFLTKLVGSGAANKYVPTEAFIAPESFVIGLLNGYFSGDGTVREGSISASSVSYRLIEGISMLCSRLGIYGSISKKQQKKNNLGTVNIKPIYDLRLGGQWAKRFSEKITLLEENKNKKLKEHKWISKHRTIKFQNNVAFDEIVEINLIDPKNHPKMYDLTITSTFTFGLANGLLVMDTSQTGYIQRQLIKGLEDLMINYDGTNRNARGIVVQIVYGENGINQSTQTEVKFDIISLNNDQVKEKLGFSPEQIKKLEKSTKMSNKELTEYNNKYIKKVIALRDELRDIQFRASCDYKVMKESYVLPINLLRITQFYSKKKENLELKPHEVEDAIEEFLTNYDNRIITLLKPDDKFMKKDDRYLKFLLETALYDYLAPVKCIFEYGLSREDLNNMMKEIKLSFIKSIIEPGEMVGELAAQSIGEPTSQMTLNTKHFAGAAKKTSSTTGVPRIQELLHYSKNIKTPQMIIYFQEPYATDRSLLNKIASNFKYLNIRQLFSSVDVYYDVGANDRLGKEIKSDNVSMPFYINNQKVDVTTLPFVFRIKMNIEKMLDKETSLLDIKTKFVSYWYKNYTNIKNLKKSDKEVISRISRCAILSNTPSDKEQVIHIRFSMSSFSYTIVTDFLKMVLDDVTLKGIENIDNIDIVPERKVSFDEKTGNMIDNKEFVIYTSGINYEKITQIKGVDFTRTRTNDIATVLRLYGIEAARQILMYELTTTYSDSGSNININHLSLLVDQMCHMGEITSMDRHGLSKIDIDPIARASFEKTMDHFINAAIFNEKDSLKSVSSRIALGKVIGGGTGAFELLLDTKKIENSEYTENESGGRITFTPLEEEPLILDIMKSEGFELSFYNPLV